MALNFPAIFTEVSRILSEEKSVKVSYHFTREDCSEPHFVPHVLMRRGSGGGALTIPDSPHFPKSALPPGKLDLSIAWADWIHNDALVLDRIEEELAKVKAVTFAARFYIDDTDRREMMETNSRNDDFRLLSLALHMELPQYHYCGQSTGYDFDPFFTASELELIRQAAQS